MKEKDDNDDRSFIKRLFGFKGRKMENISQRVKLKFTYHQDLSITSMGEIVPTDPSLIYTFFILSWAR